MLIFTKTVEGKIIIPVERIYNIVGTSCSVFINYDSGDIVNVEGNYVKKIDSVRVTLDSADEVDKIIRQFYKACAANQNAFYFG